MMGLLRIIFTVSFAFISLASFSQERSINAFLSDSSMWHASVSLCVNNAENGERVIAVNSEKSLIPASVMKLITSAAALELLGPEYTFKTSISYTGSLNKRSGKLKGDIIIRGGGDPALGSRYFSDHYQDFAGKWINEIRNLGIKKIEGRILTDDSYYDYQPVPAKWLWEDTGNYYGAGVYGLSVFDNTLEIHLKTSSENTIPVIKRIVPSESRVEFSNMLIAAGTSDECYVFSSPYSKSGWIAGSIPPDSEDFILKASVTDPPLLIATIITNRLDSENITVSGDPSTFRSELKKLSGEIVLINETISPPLKDIIEVLNHESVNLYAEHLLKELGKKYKYEGSTAAGIEVIKGFLQSAGIETDGMFMEDGSGLSALDAINTKELNKLLIYMKNRSRFFPEYLSSLPAAGKEGTMKSCFKDPVFESRLRAKSGSMTKVRSYAGYFTAASGKNFVFSIIINNYTGPPAKIISGIENIMSEIVLNN